MSCYHDHAPLCTYIPSLPLLSCSPLYASTALLTCWCRLFERGSSFVGLDFLAHPFWDKYIEYEERQDAQDRVFAIHARIIRIPMHQYARYYERFRGLIHSQPLAAAVDSDTLARFRSEVEAEGGVSRPELEIERDVRAKIDSMFYEVFTLTQAEVTKRWTYESEIKRPYFHVTELEHSQLVNWRKYLDFEELEGDFQRIVCLYERCLVTCAFYDEFWFRYARWMLSQENKDEDTRNIYIRASTMFVPLSRPGIRMQWAYFEESTGRVDVALDIHASILMQLPTCLEVIVSWANVQRRQNGVDAACQVFKDLLESPNIDLYTKGAVVGEWANLLGSANGSTEEVRSIFTKNVKQYSDSRTFWDRWFDFELEQTGSDQSKHMKRIFDEMRSKSRLSSATKQELTQFYMTYLVQRGGKDAMKLFIQVDREMFGPTSVSFKPSSNPKENGSTFELDEASRLRAETRYLPFYAAQGEPAADAQGHVDFN